MVSEVRAKDRAGRCVGRSGSVRAVGPVVMETRGSPCPEVSLWAVLPGARGCKAPIADGVLVGGVHIPRTAFRSKCRISLNFHVDFIAALSLAILFVIS